MITIYPDDIDSLRNMNERRVWNLLADFIDRNQQFNHRQDVIDIAAITLNTIPPHYQAYDTDLTAAISKISDEQIISTIRQAAEKVKKNPHRL